LISLEILRRHPELFSGGIIMSPTLWWADAAVIDSIEADPSPLKSARIWLDAGTREGLDEQTEFYVNSVKRLDEILTQAEIEHRLMIEDGAQHNEMAWAVRFDDAIRYLMKAESD